MSKYLFVLTKGPDDPGRALRCLELAKMAVMKGHAVNVFLMDEAVRYACLADDCRATASGQEEVASLVRFLRKAKADLLVCRRSATGRLDDDRRLPGGVSLAHEMTMLDLAEEAKTFVF